MALEDSRYCYSPTADSNSPALPNSPSSFSRNSSTASSPATVCDIKMSSKHGIVVDDEDMDINVDDDEVMDYKTTSTTTTKSSGQLNIGKFSFSITNILSDTFGPRNIKSEHPEQHPSDMKLFRPFEIKNFIANNSVNRAASFVNQNFNSSSSVFLNSFRLSDIFNDYSSTKASNVDIKPSDNNLRNSIYNTFSSYPKIHEEILNHKAAKLTANPQTTSSSSSSTIGKFTSSSSSSSSHALGGLCKTISQIGQENCLSPPLRHHSAASLTTSSNKSYSEKSTESTVDSDDCQSEASINTKDDSQKMWPAWIFCTRYSDRPSSGPRYRRPKEKKEKTDDEKRPRTAFSNEQLQRLKREFIENRYLSEKRRQALSAELGLNEAQIKIWFQNKRAKMKKTSGVKNSLALQLMAQGLYNHTTVALTKEEEELELRMNGQMPSM